MKNKLLNIIFIIFLSFVVITPFKVYAEETNEIVEESKEEIIETEETTNDEIIEDENKEEVVEQQEEVQRSAPMLRMAPQTPSVLYTTHVQNIGWQSYVKDGAMAGTSGRSLRLEAIKIKLDNANGNILYRTHIQNIGWENSFKTSDQVSGKTGQSLRLEAIEIKLDGDIANNYDVYYRVHAQNFGWLGWARNGEQAGTAGYAYRLEGIEIKLIPKGQSFNEYGQKEAYKYKKVLYTTHVQNVGWQSYTSDGGMAGTSGRSLRLEAIKIKIDNQEYTGDIEYKTHVENIGWQNYVKNDQLSGTQGKSYRLEAIKIRLTGEMADHFDVYYRVHAQNFGWLDWAKNDEISGTIGYAYRLEGIEIKLIKKGESAPGKTDKPNVIRYVRYKSNNKNYVYDGAQSSDTSKQEEFINPELVGPEYSGSINYSSYVSNEGWQNYLANGKNSNNANKKIEAIKIKLTGEMANHFDVYYSAYIYNTGWTGWAKNDSQCGNIGNGKYITSYKVKLVEKNKPAPGNTNNTYAEAAINLTYSSYVEGSKWQNSVNNGQTSGTTGQSKSIQGIKINTNKKIPKGSISYSVHVAYSGWRSYIADGNVAGSVGRNIEAIKIKLTDELAKQYDIYYRVHVANVGWMGWTSNDNKAGTANAALGIEAIEIKLVKKGDPTPTNTSDTATTDPYLEARWETDAKGNKYYYDVFGNMVKGRTYKMGNETYYFGPTGIFLGDKNLEVLDISAHNGKVDWKKVAESGIYGVILRVAASSIYRDSRLPENIAGVKQYGIPYGIYIYSYAENYEEGVGYAKFTKELMSEFDMHPTLGIFLDLESNNVTQFMGPDEYTEVVKGFYSVIPEAEVYTYTNYADTALNTPYIRDKITWMADYRSKCYYEGSYKMWQYTSTGTNPGVTGDVDKSILYR